MDVFPILLLSPVQKIVLSINFKEQAMKSLKKYFPVAKFCSKMCCATSI